MPERVTQKRIDEFVSALERLGGSAGNIRLRQELGWDEEFYWKVQGQLVEQGTIVPGRGKGGSARFTTAETSNVGMASLTLPVAGIGSLTDNDATTIGRCIRERDLYEPLKVTIETKWIKRFGFDQLCVEETHSQGSKVTGGTFTRPDITTAGLRQYVFLPKRLEIITFEVKSASSVDVMGILEAIAHREAAHRAYVIYAVSRAVFEVKAEAERIMELAQKYGIGLIFVDSPDNVETWEISLDATRHEPDPARLDRFLGDLPSERMKKEVQRWRG